MLENRYSRDEIIKSLINYPFSFIVFYWHLVLSANISSDVDLDVEQIDPSLVIRPSVTDRQIDETRFEILTAAESENDGKHHPKGLKCIVDENSSEESSGSSEDGSEKIEKRSPRFDRRPEWHNFDRRPGLTHRGWKDFFKHHDEHRGFKHGKKNSNMTCLLIKLELVIFLLYYPFNIITFFYIQLFIKNHLILKKFLTFNLLYKPIFVSKS